MASINDMAIKAYPKPELKDYYCDSKKVARQILCETAYKQGANEVLSEIEKVVNNARFYSDLSTKSKFYEDIVKKIKELKDK